MTQAFPLHLPRSLESRKKKKLCKNVIVPTGLWIQPVPSESVLFPLLIQEFPVAFTQCRFQGAQGCFLVPCLNLTRAHTLETGEQCRAGGRYLEFFLQLSLKLLCPRGQYQSGGQRGGASQQHGVGAVQELVTKEVVILPTPVNLLWDGDGGGRHRKAQIYYGSMFLFFRLTLRDP